MVTDLMGDGRTNVYMRAPDGKLYVTPDRAEWVETLPDAKDHLVAVIQLTASEIGGAILAKVLGRTLGPVLGKLGRTLGKSVPLGTRQAAREALSGPLGAAANRFFKGAGKNSRDFRITDIAEGGKKFEYFTPARSAGYGKQYMQAVNKSGEIIYEVKFTVGPNNSILKYTWVHGKP